MFDHQGRGADRESQEDQHDQKAGQSAGKDNLKETLRPGRGLRLRRQLGRRRVAARRRTVLPAGSCGGGDEQEQVQQDPGRHG